jgi:hypothetical protein
MFTKIKKVVLGALGFVGLAATHASAALTVDQQSAVDSIDLLISDLSTWAWAAVLTMMGVMIGIKLVKKFVGKATS